jgi:hypothetical protein
MERAFGITHGMAECLDCGWSTQQYKNAQATAARHAKAHGHKVSVEIAMSGYYDGRAEREKER